jgi:hypothetical protein
MVDITHMGGGNNPAGKRHSGANARKILFRKAKCANKKLITTDCINNFYQIFKFGKTEGVSRKKF